MKRLVLLTVVFVCAAAFLIVGGQGYFTTASAQSVGRANDAELARLIKRLTDRSTENVTGSRSPETGGIGLNTSEGFQNVMLGRMENDGEPFAACVTGLGEANDFFGRNLETGAPVQTTFVKDEVAADAARHGMSKDEFLFYSKMIADAAAQRAASPNAATLTIINADGAGEGFNDATATTVEGGNTGATRGEQRLILFNFAAGIWGAYLDSSVQININSQFNSLAPCGAGGGVLGSAGSATSFRDFTAAPLTGTWYPVALANKITGVDNNGATQEINARFNSDVDTGCLSPGTRFYYGLNNTTPGGRINLLVVLLHEMGHGLGFASLVNGTSGAMANGFPDAYLTNMFDRTTGKYWKDMTNAERQASALNVNNVLWDGANVKSASSFLTAGRDSNGRVMLYTPSPFEGGSSISHFSDASAPNLLMEPAINFGLPLDLDLTRQVMRDIGWYRDTNGDRVPDTIEAVTMGGNAVIGSPVTVRWTNTGGFDKNVTIELSLDGGATFASALATNVTNAGTFTFTVPNSPTSQARIRIREAGFVAPAGSSADFRIATDFTAPDRTAFDYDGDGKADVSVFRPGAAGVWFVQNSANGSNSINQFGATGDVSVPADFDGDGKTDVAIFRPSSGIWYWLKSSDGQVGGNQFGAGTDLPVPADYDGDGKADIAIFRPSTGTWWILRSATGLVSADVFGITDDRPTIGDYDGDGKADLAVFRPSSGVWYHLKSTNGAFSALTFGTATDKAVPADYDGDGKTDVAIYRPSTGGWYWVNSSNSAVNGNTFGVAEDLPVAGDYDGDGRADIAVFRPSQGIWYLLQTTAGLSGQQYGTAGDIPTPNSFVR